MVQRGMVSCVSAVHIECEQNGFVCHLDLCRCSLKGTYALRAPLFLCTEMDAHCHVSKSICTTTASTFIIYLIATTVVIDQKNCRWIFVSGGKCLATRFNGYPWNVSTDFSGSEACTHRFIPARVSLQIRR